MPSPDPPSFTLVAPWYDILMAGVPYEYWVRYLHELLTLHNAKPLTVLDLACGAGAVSRLLAKIGYPVVGVDGSAPMIAEAERLTPDGAVEYVCQRMEALNLGRRFDLVISLFDSLNYLTDPKDLARAFRRVARHMEPGALFIFDMNGEYAFTADLFTQERYGHRRKIEYSWKSHYDPDTRLCRVEMTFQVRKGNRREEFHEVHIQRAYAVDEVNAMLQDAGLTLLATYDAYSTRPVRDRSDRIFWVARYDAEASAPVDDDGEESEEGGAAADLLPRADRDHREAA